MDFDLIILSVMIILILCSFVYLGTRDVDNNYKYNNMQSNYIKPANFVKKVFKLKSTLLPRWVCYRYYVYVVFILLTIPSIIAYIIYKNKGIPLICVGLQVCFALLDVFLISIFTTINRKKTKKSVSLSEALNYPESTEPPEE